MLQPMNAREQEPFLREIRRIEETAKWQHERIAELEAENEVLRKAVKAYEDQAVAENRGAIVEAMRGKSCSE